MYRNASEHEETPLSDEQDRAVVRESLEKRGQLTSKQLGEILGVRHKKSANIEIRRIVLDLIAHDKVPVVATHQGYFIAQTADDVDEYCDWLEAYKVSLDFRIRSIKKAWGSRKARRTNTPAKTKKPSSEKPKKSTKPKLVTPITRKPNATTRRKRIIGGGGK